MVTFIVIKTSINGVKSINAMFNEPRIRNTNNGMVRGVLVVV